jgi:hypothetical protein
MARPTWMLIVVATLLNGILAGVTVDRILVGLPAWHAIGAIAWANYSRSADLGMDCWRLLSLLDLLRLLRP